MGKAINRLMRAAGSNAAAKGSGAYKAAGLALQGNRVANSLKSRKLGTATREGVRLGKMFQSNRS